MKSRGSLYIHYRGDQFVHPDVCRRRVLLSEVLKSAQSVLHKQQPRTPIRRNPSS